MTTPKVEITIDDILTAAETFLDKDENFRRCVTVAAKARVKAMQNGGQKLEQESVKGRK